MKHNYQVVVGNVGTMDYTNKKLATDCYKTYVTLSMKGETRAANEPVTLFKDGEIIEEYTPKPVNLIAAMFNIEVIKEQIAKCPIDECVILCGNWSINKPIYPLEDYDVEQEAWDFDELAEMLDTTLLVSDYNDLVADPHGLYSL